MTVQAPIFAADPLPRGPHGLSAGEVAASQRTRLFAALAEVVAEKGYAAAGVAEISRRAGVSPTTFYAHFDGKLACMLAGYDALAAALLEAIAAAITPEADWPEFISASLLAYLGTLEADPPAARAFLVEIDGAGPEARARRHATYAQFAGLVKARHEQIRATDPALGPLPDRAYLLLVLGIRELVANALETETRPRLTALAPDVLRFIAAAVAGASAT
jgi:AcrR family transcriptional regulator